MIMRTLTGQLLAALRTLLVLTVLLGLLYPLAVTGIAQVAFRDNANGSLLKVEGRTVGSELIGQAFVGADGKPLPQWFQSRASNAGHGYDPTATAASNLGPEDVTDTPDDPATQKDDSHTSLLTLICTRSKQVGGDNGVDGGRPYCGPDGLGTAGRRGTGNADRAAVPPDAVTSSSSGLDPHISPAYARLQVQRVARARGLPVEQVRALVEAQVQGRTLGFLGAPRVNVLRLNLALARLG
ncbi:MAG: potassium-transporting ATPase subunit C [Frankiales bacterium]|nr:potassium-transporting ATPase subunit C [Frankiales bacterium]